MKRTLLGWINVFLNRLAVELRALKADMVQPAPTWLMVFLAFLGLLLMFQGMVRDDLWAILLGLYLSAKYGVGSYVESNRKRPK